MIWMKRNNRNFSLRLQSSERWLWTDTTLSNLRPHCSEKRLERGRVSQVILLGQISLLCCAVRDSGHLAGDKPQRKKRVAGEPANDAHPLPAQPQSAEPEPGSPGGSGPMPMAISPTKPPMESATPHAPAYSPMEPVDQAGPSQGKDLVFVRRRVCLAVWGQRKQHAIDSCDLMHLSI